MTLDTVRRPARLSLAPSVARLAGAMEEVAQGRANLAAEALVAFATVRELSEVVQARRAQARRARWR